MRKGVFGQMGTVKAQISLHIQAVLSEDLHYPLKESLGTAEYNEA